MTTIAWDGKTLTADKQSDTAGLKTKVTKIKKIRGHLVFSGGDFDRINCLYDWFEKGAKEEDWPAFQSTDAWNSLNVITPEGKILRYERSPIPWELEETFYACGSGRDYAIAAMALGKNSKEAVLLSSRFDPHTGADVDCLEL